jgi:hypothetical protein
MVMGSTTDARYYLNQFGVPAVAYGPRSRNIHGTDEAVETGQHRVRRPGPGPVHGGLLRRRRREGTS